MVSILNLDKDIHTRNAFNRKNFAQTTRYFLEFNFNVPIGKLQLSESNDKYAIVC